MASFRADRLVAGNQPADSLAILGYGPGMAKTSVDGFFERHPELSMAVLAAYYPVPADLLAAYADEWDWNILSENPRLGWSEELIAKHREKWSECDLLTNPGVIWTADLITRLLGKQVQDEWYSLSQNPSLPVDEAFLTQFAKKINWSWLSQNPGIAWTPELLDGYGKKELTWAEGREQLFATALHSGNVAAERWAAARLPDKTVKRIRAQVAQSQRVALTVAAIVKDPDRKRLGGLLEKPLAEWSDTWLTQLESDISWLHFARSPHLPWSLAFFDRHAKHIEGDTIAANQVIWHKAFAPQLTEADVRRFVTARYPRRFIKYFALERASRDSYGCLPDVKAKKKFAEIAEDHYWARPQVIELEHDPIMEGPPRFTDFVQWRSNEPEGCILIVSERMAAVLKSLSLPEHTTYEAKVRCNPAYQRKYGKEPHRYVVFHFLHDTFLKQLDVAQTPLSLWSYRDDKERTECFPAGKFATAEDALARRDAGRRERPKESVILLPTALHHDSAADESRDVDFASPLFPLRFHGDSDLVWLIGAGLLVSETFKSLVVAQGFTGMSFKKWGNDSLFFADAETEEAKRRKRQLIQQGTLGATPPTTDHAGEVFRALEVRRDTVLERADRVAALQRQKTTPETPAERQVEAVERKLDVCLPPLYRALCTGAQKLPSRPGWKWLALKDVFCIGDDWQKSRPEAVRAIAVASNGLGDHLGFLLQADSLTQLDDTLVEFKHESALIEPLPRRLQLKPKLAKSDLSAAPPAGQRAARQP